MIKKIIDKIKSRITGEFKCPAYWWEKGYEDCDEGCHIYNTIDCYKCKYRFNPNFLIKRKVDLILKKENEYWEQRAKELEALQTTHNSESPKCSLCNKELLKEGAIFFTPPSDDIVMKYNICEKCFHKVMYEKKELLKIIMKKDSSKK